MRPILATIVALAAFTLCATGASAATLEVGAGKSCGRIEDALALAAPGDQIVVFARAANAPYEKVALQIKMPRLTIRAADAQSFIKLDGTGFDYSGAGPTPRAIVQFNAGADGCVLEGFELANARNDSCNGAGVRINQANDITIRRCKIHDNDMGIMSNGAVAAHSGANQLIEGCTITDNGTGKQPGYNHNLYLGGTSVTVRGCEIARSLTGHNLKSRAHLNWIEYNYIHDSANRELDLVDEKGNTDVPASHAILLGNIIVKKIEHMDGNKTAVHFGQDGKQNHTGMLYLVHNTIVTPYISPVVDLSAPGAGAVFINNLIADGGAKQAGVLAAVRNGATLVRVSGQGNELAVAFRAKAPMGVKQSDLVAWSKILMPWPGVQRPALQEFQGVGVLRPRSSVSAGAGQPPATDR